MEKLIGSLSINSDASIKEAMQQLDFTAEKILFVIDNNRLLGTLTDGDIRRWILNGGALNETAVKICNKNPLYFFEDFSVNEVKEKMILKKITCVPIINSDYKIIKLIFWNEVFGESFHKFTNFRLDVPVVIMAGGKGTRLDPLTRILPKPLIPIGDKTIIEIIINNFLNYQIQNFYLTINHKAKIIKSYFEELNPPYNISYIQEEKPLGTAGSLKYLEGEIDGNIFITNCDIIVNTNYYDLLEFHKNNDNDITLVASMKHYHVPYGICEIESGGSLVKINEKPEYNFLVNTGMYVIESKVLKMIPRNEFFHMTHLIEKLKKEGGKVGIFPVSESSWIDVGEWEEYKKALESFKI